MTLKSVNAPVRTFKRVRPSKDRLSTLASTTTGGNSDNSRCAPWCENLMQGNIVGADANKCQAYYDIMNAATN